MSLPPRTLSEELAAERVAALEALLEQRDSRIQEMEEALGVTTLPPLEFGLTGHEAAVLGILLNREVVTKQAMLCGLYSARADDAPNIKIVDVYVCKLRKKLAPFGVEVATHWGVGYSMPAGSKALVRAMMQPVAA